MKKLLVIIMCIAMIFIPFGIFIGMIPTSKERTGEEILAKAYENLLKKKYYQVDYYSKLIEPNYENENQFIINAVCTEDKLYEQHVNGKYQYSYQSVNDDSHYNQINDISYRHFTYEIVDDDEYFNKNIFKKNYYSKESMFADESSSEYEYMMFNYFYGEESFAFLNLALAYKDSKYSKMALLEDYKSDDTYARLDTYKVSNIQVFNYIFKKELKFSIKAKIKGHSNDGLYSGSCNAETKVKIVLKKGLITKVTIDNIQDINGEIFNLKQVKNVKYGDTDFMV